MADANFPRPLEAGQEERSAFQKYYETALAVASQRRR